MYLKEKIKKIISGFEIHGSEFLLFIVSLCLPGWMFRYSHTYLFQGKNLLIKSKQNNDYEIRFVAIDDIERLKNFRTDIEKLQDRLRRGDVCVVTVRRGDDSVVACLWAATGELYSEYTGTYLNTGDDGFYLYSVYTVEEEHGKGLYSNMLLCLIDYYENFGRSFVYAKVDFFNALSTLIKKKIGFNIVGESFFIKLFKFNICYYRYWNSRFDSKFVNYSSKYTNNFKLV